MEEVRLRGNEYHGKEGVKPLTAERLDFIVGADFLMAEDLVNLSEDNLREIITASEGKPTSPEMEEQLVNTATRLLDLQGIDFEYPQQDAGDSSR